MAGYFLIYAICEFLSACFFEATGLYFTGGLFFFLAGVSIFCSAVIAKRP